MELPRNYNKRLRRAYPDCRVRWSNRRGCWLLERKADYERLDINPANYPADAIDTFIQHRDGYYEAGFYGPRNLPQVDKLIDFLRSQDPKRLALGGGTAWNQADRMADAIEAAEQAKDAKYKKDNSFYESGMGGELYDRLAWDEGRRVAVPKNAQGL